MLAKNPRKKFQNFSPMKLHSFCEQSEKSQFKDDLALCPDGKKNPHFYRGKNNLNNFFFNCWCTRNIVLIKNKQICERLFP